MITQYTGSYNNPPSDAQNLIANKVKVLDSYVLMQTGENEYTGIVYNNLTGAGEVYTFTRSSSGYSSSYSVSCKATDEFNYTVTNELYVFSNDGVGKSLDLPVMEGVQAHGIAILLLVVLFAVVFKGALFKWLRK